MDSARKVENRPIYTKKKDYTEICILKAQQSIEKNAAMHFHSDR
jgi:hypothetical protein